MGAPRLDVAPWANIWFCIGAVPESVVRGWERRLRRMERLHRSENERGISLTRVTAIRTGQVVHSTHALKVGFRAGEGSQCCCRSPT